MCFPLKKKNRVCFVAAFVSQKKNSESFQPAPAAVGDDAPMEPGKVAELVTTKYVWVVF